MLQTFTMDCRDALDLYIPEGSVQTCITSPPYFGLRDYGHPGQLGLEQTPDQYTAAMVDVFRSVRRVLADDGTLWLNIGDSYANTSTYNASRNSGDEFGRVEGKRQPRAPTPQGVKPKDLIGIPWMLALALRDDGAASPAHMRDIAATVAAVTESYETREQWPERLAALVERLQREHVDANRGGWYLRQDIVWNKPNPMPESVTDRCTKAHEYLFLLSKSPRYYFDNAAIKEDAVYSGLTGQDASGFKNPKNFNGKHAAKPGIRGEQRSARDTFKRADSKRAAPIHGQDYGTHRADRPDDAWDTGKRNKRSVWTVATRPYAGAHFATFPPALVEPCVLAGSRPGDLVLDPFGGSGTTAGVALAHGRHAVLCELNHEYADLVPARIASVMKSHRPAAPAVLDNADLF